MYAGTKSYVEIYVSYFWFGEVWKNWSYEFDHGGRLTSPKIQIRQSRLPPNKFGGDLEETNTISIDVSNMCSSQNPAEIFAFPF